MSDRQIYIYDSASKTVSAEPLVELLKYLPGKVAQCRIFSTNHEYDHVLATALEAALNEERPAHPTNL
jgi:ABC-type branched-subunit amino acid transport system substrate-binding protein